MRKSIIFTSTINFDGIEKPKPASSFIPEWYKETNSYLKKEKNELNSEIPEGTIKKCIPVFDAITSGYIITLPADIIVSQKTGQDGIKRAFFSWSAFELITFHTTEQAKLYPADSGDSYPKFMNPWGIKTPRGWSVLITNPLHRDLPFTILTGVVDTDTYNYPINFPFVLKDKNWEGIIPKGTPIAQIIPIKRESWKLKLGDSLDLKKIQEDFFKLSSMFSNRYKKMFWARKEYI